VKRFLLFLLLGFSALAQGAEGLWARYCAQLKDEELAALLNHLMALLKAKGEPYKPEEIREERDQNLAPDQIKRP